ncbi:hypothetical protein BH11BAC5_BH11BAC5_48630 [soil metagenome]
MTAENCRPHYVGQLNASRFSGRICNDNSIYYMGCLSVTRCAFLAGLLLLQLNQVAYLLVALCAAAPSISFSFLLKQSSFKLSFNFYIIRVRGPTKGIEAGS